MIFDFKDALLIVGFLILAVCFGIELFLKIKSGDPDCDHCFAEYQSRGVRACIDCGFEDPIIKPHYPKHQR